MTVDPNLYVPPTAVITAVRNLTAGEKLFTLRHKDGSALPPTKRGTPGEYVSVYVPGVGEAPISLCSAPSATEEFEIAVRRIPTGVPAHANGANLATLLNVTTALHQMGPGAEIGIRGPFGTELPLHELHGKDIAIIAGGIGMFPCRRPMLEILENRGNFGYVWFLFGTNTPEELYFPEDLEAWKQYADVQVISVKGSDTWTGPTGFVTALIPSIAEPVKIGEYNTVFNPENVIAYVVGPPAMFRPVIKELGKIGLPDENIYLSLEGKMSCSVGKCGNCRCGKFLVCEDGPVFSYDQVKFELEAGL